MKAAGQGLVTSSPDSLGLGSRYAARRRILGRTRIPIHWHLKSLRVRLRLRPDGTCLPAPGPGPGPGG
jgi:hypothetical protein